MASILNTFKTNKVTSWLLILLLVSFSCTFILFTLNSKSNAIVYIESQLSGSLKVEKDSWEPMMIALDYFKGHPDQSIYKEVFFKQGTKFQYPLSSLLIFDLPQRIGGSSYEQTIYCLNLLSFISVFLVGLTSAAILSTILKQDKFKHLTSGSSLETFQIWFLTVILTLFFYPILRSYILGQIQTILTLLVSLSLLTWLYNKKKLTGVLLGIVCLIKPQMALIFIWALIRKQWGMVLSGLFVVVIFSAVSVQFYGFQNNLDYLEVLSFLSRRGEVFYANQSVNGLVNRLMFNGSNLDWDGKFPQYLPVVYIVTLVTSLLFMLGGLWWNYKNKYPDLIDFCIVILATTMASPIAWEHHFGIILPIMILMVPFLIYYFMDRKKWFLFLFLAAFVLCSQYLGFTKIFAATYLNFVQSYLFFGALIILYLLFCISIKNNKDQLANKSYLP